MAYVNTKNYNPFLPSYIFFSNTPPTTQIYTLSLHDALPISPHRSDDAHGAVELGLRRLVTRQRDDIVDLRVHQRHTDRKSTRLNSSHITISYAVFCLKKKTPKHSLSSP